MKYQCIEDRVLIRENKRTESEKTDGGLYIPDTAARPVREGTVYDIGEGRYASESGAFMATIIKRGDVVLFGESTGTPLTLETENGREELYLMRESDLLIRVQKKEDNS